VHFGGTHARGQNFLQPEFAKSDEQLRRDQTLHSACVAVIRSGNERAVKMAKNSWLIKRGCVDQLWDLDMLAEVWSLGVSKFILCMTLFFRLK
jgi:hypothetical protein